MNIRFCEFCSTVLHDGSTHCSVCGARMTQEVTEQQFNDPANPWPFVPVSALTLRIQGIPRTIRFSGTHSVYHLWSKLHEAYDAMHLCCRIRKDEMELTGFRNDQCPEGFRVLDPGMIINCRQRKFSFSAYQAVDPEIAQEPGETDLEYQGSFEIDDCPPRLWGNVLGWLVATAPRPEPDNDWTYDI